MFALTVPINSRNAVESPQRQGRPRNSKVYKLLIVTMSTTYANDGGLPSPGTTPAMESARSCCKAFRHRNLLLFLKFCHKPLCRCDLRVVFSFHYGCKAIRQKPRPQAGCPDVDHESLTIVHRIESRLSCYTGGIGFPLNRPCQC